MLILPSPRKKRVLQSSMKNSNGKKKENSHMDRVEIIKGREGWRDKGKQTSNADYNIQCIWEVAQNFIHHLNS